MKQPLWRRAVSYTAIGATKDPELLRHPPHGYRPMVKRRRIGHGDARWQYAWVQVMTWGVQRHSRLRVEVEPTPPEVRAGTYVPVTFDEAGEPIGAALSSAAGSDGPEGVELLAPGDSAWLIVPIGPFGIRAPVRVIYVIDEPNRRGFAYGTIAGHPEDGEERFVVERRDDGSVWLTVSSFSRPASKLWWMLYPVLRLQQRWYTNRYLRSLSGPIPSGPISRGTSGDVAYR
jgi:uncharacterized protein (UPF0548 family)